jgi:hypothetical protein
VISLDFVRESQHWTDEANPGGTYGEVYVSELGHRVVQGDPVWTHEANPGGTHGEVYVSVLRLVLETQSNI